MENRETDHYVVRIIEMSQNIENLLEKNYGANGRGLHEKLTSVESKIPPIIQRKIRFIASIRNQSVHKNTKIASKQYPNVKEKYEQILPFLEKRKMVPPKKNRQPYQPPAAIPQTNTPSVENTITHNNNTITHNKKPATGSIVIGVIVGAIAGLIISCCLDGYISKVTDKEAFIESWESVCGCICFFIFWIGSCVLLSGSESDEAGCYGCLLGILFGCIGGSIGGIIGTVLLNVSLPLWGTVIFAFIGGIIGYYRHRRSRKQQKVN